MHTSLPFLFIALPILSWSFIKVTCCRCCFLIQGAYLMSNMTKYPLISYLWNRNLWPRGYIFTLSLFDNFFPVVGSPMSYIYFTLFIYLNITPSFLMNILVICQKPNLLKNITSILMWVTTKTQCWWRIFHVDITFRNTLFADCICIYATFALFPY